MFVNLIALTRMFSQVKKPFRGKVGKKPVAGKRGRMTVKRSLPRQKIDENIKVLLDQSDGQHLTHNRLLTTSRPAFSLFSEENS
jgi:hypothetical protein